MSTNKTLSYEKIVSECEATIELLSAEKDKLIVSNTEKDRVLKSQKKQLVSAKHESNQLILLSSQLKKHYDQLKDDYQTLKQQPAEPNSQKHCEECKEFKATVRRLEDENHFLNKKLNTLENQNNLHKQKLLAVSHTAIKTQELCAKSIQEVSITDKNCMKEMLKGLQQKMNNQFKSWEKNVDKKATENLAKNVANVSHNMKHIHKKQRIMQKKTADGKVQCGSCEKTFVSSTDLKIHMTTKHKMNTTDLSKNKVQIIEID